MARKIDPEDARQGERSGIVRYILIASMVLAVIAVAAVGFGTSG